MGCVTTTRDRWRSRPSTSGRDTTRQPPAGRGAGLRRRAHRRLTVVCAPAGYGKTTDAAAVLERLDCKTSWYKLDLLDHDPLAFLAGLVRAVRRACPASGTHSWWSSSPGRSGSCRQSVLAARFCSECDRLVTDDLHLVLDDYHEAMDAAAMNDVLGYLLENCPATIRFVVLTRYEPAFRLEKLRLEGEVAPSLATFSSSMRGRSRTCCTRGPGRITTPHISSAFSSSRRDGRQAWCWPGWRSRGSMRHRSESR